MKISELINTSKQNMRKNGLFSIIIMFFAGLICASVLMVNLLFADLFLIVVPLIVLPTLFSFQRAIIVLREENVLSFSLVLSGYRQYFSPRFASTYSFFKSLLKLLIVFVASTFIASLVVNLYFYNADIMGFKQIADQIMYSITSYEELYAIIEEHADLFALYEMATMLPPLFLVTIFGLFFFSISGHSFFVRISALKYPGSYLKELFARFYKNNRASFLRSYFALNWPLYLLFVGGLALGAYVGSIFSFTYGSIFTFAVAFAIFLSIGVYGSIYFANKEALYFAYIDKIQKEDTIIKAKFKRTLEELRKEQNMQEIIDELEEYVDEEEQKK